MADTYNHKIKMITGKNGNICYDTALGSWIGVSTEKNPSIIDGIGIKTLLNEPNGCRAKTSLDKF